MVRTTTRNKKKVKNQVAKIIAVSPLERVNDYNPLRVAWVVSGYRKDKRTGVINPAPGTKYGEKLLQAVFRKWG